MLKPLDMAIGDAYVCILHEEKSDGDQIYVYGAENMDFKYAFDDFTELKYISF
jgi:hypothetical protein